MSDEQGKSDTCIEKKTTCIGKNEEEREKKAAVDMMTELLEAVRRKATGYEATEVVDEYALVDGELALVKRKITKKDVAPDMTAIKFLADEASADAYSNMSLEELEAEKTRLLKLLKEAENATDKNKSQD